MQSSSRLEKDQSLFHQEHQKSGEKKDDDLDLSNDEIKEILQKSNLKDITYEQLILQKNERIKGYHDN
jgi:hypothetical protein